MKAKSFILFIVLVLLYTNIFSQERNPPKQFDKQVIIQKQIDDPQGLRNMPNLERPDNNCLPVPRPFSNLPKLTLQQKMSLDSLNYLHRKSILPLENQLGELNAKLKTVSTIDNPDMNEIYKLLDNIGDLNTRISKERETHRQKIRKILNPEQRLEFEMTLPPHHIPR